MNRALFGKEFRYGIGRLLALPLLCIAAGYGLTLLQDGELRNNQFSGLFSELYQASTTVACALIGLACGLWQVMRETGPGPWAFLRHRPVSASRLFLMKLTAALVIYALIAGIPIAGTILWAATPGRLHGPWLWPMAMPPLMDLFAGSVYVPVGMLIATREARWFGSRILPIGLGAFASITAWAPWFWVAAASVAICWAVALGGAWSSFINRGSESRQGGSARFVTALTLVPAAIALPVFVGMAVLTLVNSLHRQQTPSYSGYYQVLAGELYEYDPARNDKPYRRALDDRGQLTEDAPYEDVPRGYWTSVQFARFHEYVMSYRERYRYFDSDRIGNDVSHRWFYMHQENLIQEWIKPPAGNSELRSFIGSAGRSPTRELAVPFRPTVALYYQQPLITPIAEPDRVLQIDRGTGEVSTVFRTPPGERALSAGTLYTGEVPRSLTIATDAAVYVVDSEQRVLLRHPHEPGYAMAYVSADSSLTKFGLLYHTLTGDQRQLFAQVSSSGEMLARTELPLMRMDVPSNSLVHVTEALMIPPAGAAIEAGYSLLYEKLHWKHAVALIAAFVGALANWLLIRRDAVGRGWSIFWAAVGALGGFAGILMLLWTHDFSVRVRCWSCGRPRVVRRKTCEHCHAQFAPPPANGIAIFDHADQETPAAA